MCEWVEMWMCVNILYLFNTSQSPRHLYPTLDIISRPVPICCLEAIHTDPGIKMLALASIKRARKLLYSRAFVYTKVKVQRNRKPRSGIVLCLLFISWIRYPSLVTLFTLLYFTQISPHDGLPSLPPTLSSQTRIGQ